MGDKKEFRHESLQDPQSVAQYLGAIQRGLASGKLSLRDSGGEIHLEPGELIRLAVKASRRRDEVGLTLRLRWKAKDLAAPAEGGVLEIVDDDDA